MPTVTLQQANRITAFFFALSAIGILALGKYVPMDKGVEIGLKGTAILFIGIAMLFLSVKKYDTATATTEGNMGVFVVGILVSLVGVVFLLKGICMGIRFFIYFLSSQ